MQILNLVLTKSPSRKRAGQSVWGYLVFPRSLARGERLAVENPPRFSRILWNEAMGICRDDPSFPRLLAIYISFVYRLASLPFWFFLSFFLGWPRLKREGEFVDG